MMKANKEFYDTLRSEVKKGEIPTVPCLFFWSRKKNNVESQGLSPQDAEKVIKLQEKIKGLQSQVELLEKRNQELIEENNRLRTQTSEPPLKILEEKRLDDGTIELLWGFARDQYNQLKASFNKGYVPIKKILYWAYEVSGDEQYISNIRNMLQDLEWDNLLKKEDYYETIQEYEKIRKERRKQPLIREVIFNKNVQNEVNGVASGATGISINRDE